MASSIMTPQANLLTSLGGDIAAGPIDGHSAIPWDATKPTPKKSGGASASGEEEKKRKWAAPNE